MPRCRDCKNVIIKEKESDCKQDAMFLNHDIDKKIFCSEYIEKDSSEPTVIKEGK